MAGNLKNPTAQALFVGQRQASFFTCENPKTAAFSGSRHEPADGENGVTLADAAKNQATEASPVFEMQGEGYKATGVISFPSLEFIVMAGSRARTNANDCLHAGGKKLKEELIANGTLKLTPDGYLFRTDWNFSSPSSAAGIVSGSPTNGRASWKTSDKTTYAEYLALKDGAPLAPSTIDQSLTSDHLA